VTGFCLLLQAKRLRMGLSTDTSNTPIGVIKPRQHTTLLALLLSSRDRLDLSTGNNRVDSTWRRRHNPVSKTLCFKYKTGQCITTRTVIVASCTSLLFTVLTLSCQSGLCCFTISILVSVRDQFEGQRLHSCCRNYWDALLSKVVYLLISLNTVIYMNRKQNIIKLRLAEFIL
jgi:hypothetical protein